MEKPKVTFLMIAYNTEKYIEKAVDSILNQEEQNINLLVRDNGSTDRTGEMLREIAARDSRVLLFKNKRNWIDDVDGHYGKDGVIRIWPIKDKTLLGEYISIVDSDDWIDPDFTTQMYNAAKGVNADITVCGSTFMDGGVRKVGERLPPAITSGRLSAESMKLRGCFPQMYNTFRTWWAKLFRTDFFLEHYDEAWAGPGGENGYSAVLDTVHMLRYLVRCKGFASITKPLYNFRMNVGSYSNKYPIYFETEYAKELFNEGINVLKKLNIQTAENNSFIIQLHWAFLTEAMEGLRTQRENSPPRRELSYIAALLGNPILSGYISDNEAVIWDKMKRLALLVVGRNKGNLSLYSSFIPRLMFLEDELQKNPDNLLLYPILTGCLYDRENNNKIGLPFLKKLNIASEYKEGLYGHMQNVYHINMRLQPQQPDFIYYFAENPPVDNFHEVLALEDNLDARMAEEDYESVCDLLEQLLRKSPLSRNAMYCRIRLCVLFEEWELAAVLAGTAIAMWPNDVEIQTLCWGVMGLCP